MGTDKMNRKKYNNLSFAEKIAISNKANIGNLELENAEYKFFGQVGRSRPKKR